MMVKTGVGRVVVGVVVGALVVVLGVVSAGSAGAATVWGAVPGMSDEFSGLSKKVSYSDGAVFRNWRVVFTGYGKVSGDGSGRLVMAPKASTSPDETHAVLVVSNMASVKDCEVVAARVATNSQLRVGSAANPWETAWLVWDYVDNEHFSYVALKTNGWEVGRRDPAYPGGQRFVATGGSPAFAVGTAATVKVTSVGEGNVLNVNGNDVASFAMPDATERVGAVGMYTEDAKVSWDWVRTSECV